MNDRTFAWPGWPHGRFAALLALVNSLWFVLLYGGCDAFTAHRLARVRVDFAFEQRIPLWPAAATAYMSLYLLFLAMPFVLRTRRALASAVLAQALAILTGGIGFLLVPAVLAYPPPPDDLGCWSALFHFADELNLTYNLVPSLHVALSVASAAALGPASRGPWPAVWWSWAASIALSTLLTHQHHVVDVATGWLLGLGACRAARQFLPPSAPLRAAPHP